MDTTIQAFPQKREISLWDIAAWLVFLLPLVLFALDVGVIWLATSALHLNGDPDIIGPTLSLSFLVAAAGVFFAFILLPVSIARKRILSTIVTALAIVLNFVFGFYALMGAAVNGMGGGTN